MTQPQSPRDRSTTDTPELDAIEPDDESPSASGIRQRVSLDSLQPAPSDRVTVVFRGTLPIEGLLHFIRRRAVARVGTQPVHARVEPREGAWNVALRVAGVAVVGTAENPFLAALRAFDLLR